MERSFAAIIYTLSGNDDGEARLGMSLGVTAKLVTPHLCVYNIRNRDVHLHVCYSTKFCITLSSSVTARRLTRVLKFSRYCRERAITLALIR